VTGIYDDKGGLMGDLAVDNRVLERDFGERKDAFALVKLRPGEDAAAIERRLSAVLDRTFPAVEVLTADQFKKQQSDQVNQLLGLIYALLSLAIIVAFFGIVNTLVLSISERTRELGMLRAIGTSRRQVRRMVRLEAVITSLIGATIGAVLGVVLAVLFTRPLDDFVLTVPVGTLLALLGPRRAGGRGGRGPARAPRLAPGRPGRSGLRVADRVARWTARATRGSSSSAPASVVWRPRSSCSATASTT
jgi:putative ABC transport system permease protein